MKKNKQTKKVQIRADKDSQLNGSLSKSKKFEVKKQKWILINKQGQLSGILDHSDYDTRQRAKGWFQSISDQSGGTIKINDLYYVLKVEEYEFLKELDVLDIIADTDIN